MSDMQDTFHACTTMSDIQDVLEQMTGIDHVFLLVLHAAYANYDVDFTVTFGQAKAAFFRSHTNANLNMVPLIHSQRTLRSRQ